MKTTLGQVKKAAEKYGAEITEPLYSEYDSSYTVEAIAPDGMMWSNGECIGFVCRWFPYDKNDKSEQLRDLIERMSYGIEEFNEE